MFSEVSYFHSLRGSSSSQVYKCSSLWWLCVILGVPLLLTKLTRHHIICPIVIYCGGFLSFHVSIWHCGGFVTLQVSHCHSVRWLFCPGCPTASLWWLSVMSGELLLLSACSLYHSWCFAFINWCCFLSLQVSYKLLPSVAPCHLRCFTATHWCSLKSSYVFHCHSQR